MIGDKTVDRALDRPEFRRECGFTANSIAVQNPVVLRVVVEELHVERNALFDFFAASRCFGEHPSNGVIQLARSGGKNLEEELMLRIEVLIEHRLCHVRSDCDVVHRCRRKAVRTECLLRCSQELGSALCCSETYAAFNHRFHHLTRRSLSSLAHRNRVFLVALRSPNCVANLDSDGKHDASKDQHRDHERHDGRGERCEEADEKADQRKAKGKVANPLPKVCLASNLSASSKNWICLFLLHAYRLRSIGEFRQLRRR